MDDEFRRVLSRVKSGDQTAATEFVRKYEPMIRAVVRSRLRDPSMKRRLDESDICQSVMASFFPRMAAGRFEMSEPKDLVALLVAMARRKLNHQVRKHHQKLRDVRAAVSVDDSKFGELADDVAGPDRIAIGREQLQRLRSKLAPEDRLIADLRGEGYSWKDIAEELGGTSEARRKQFERALAAALEDESSSFQ